MGEGAAENVKTGPWKTITELGKGGQGTVYKAVNVIGIPLRPGRPDGKKQRAIRDIVRTLASDVHSASADPVQLELELAASIRQYSERLGALKVLHRGEGYEHSLQRMDSEVKAAMEVQHPQLIGILDADMAEGWLVCEYHEHGSIAGPSGASGQPKYMDMYKGDALGALRALRGIVEALALLHNHEKKLVHRDVKPGNILLADDGRLVLADLGLVFYEDKERTRVTETFESVGSSHWQPPWTMGSIPIEAIDATWDVFAIGKVLYCLIAGRRQLPWALHRNKEHDLVEIHKGKSEMKRVNALLDNCVVDEKEKCLPHAGALLEEFEKAIEDIIAETQGGRIGSRRRCRACGVGWYVALQPDRNSPGGATDPSALGRLGLNAVRAVVKVEICDHCGHVDMFSFQQARVPNAWTDLSKRQSQT